MASITASGFSILIAICLTISVTVDSLDEPVLEISSGRVRGTTLKSALGRDFKAFRGIPYAKAPVGERRFKPPEPSQNWDDIFDARQFGPECPQFNFVFKGLEGEEDCLVLNVYTPQLASKLLPVMVFIHGGGFVVGSGSHTSYGPNKFMDFDVVLVTFNYRLGILGFLNTEDELATGNYGMLDQILALRWVQNNIASFGGDPNQVTLFGESAGAASTIYHMLSPLSTGLFHAAIAQSGSPLNFWALQTNPWRHARRLAEKVGCPTSSSSQLLECFRAAPLKALVKENARFQIGAFFPFFGAPTIDKFSKAPFLSEDPLFLLQKGKIANKVPLIMGLVKDEGFPFFKDIENTFWYRPRGEPFFDNEFRLVFPYFVNDEAGDIPNSTPAIQATRRKYFGENDLFLKDVYEQGLTDLFGDAMFKVGIARTLDFFVNANVSTLAYRYTHVGQHSLAEFFGAMPGKFSSHGDELYVQFSFGLTQASPIDSLDKRMTKVINSLWTSFATKRKNVLMFEDKPFNWPLYNVKERAFLELNTQPTIKHGSFCDKIDFWVNEVPRLLKNNGQIKTEL